MFNRLLKPIFTLFNRVLRRGSAPVITEVSLYPNPVDTGKTVLLKVKIE